MQDGCPQVLQWQELVVIVNGRAVVSIHGSGMGRQMTFKEVENSATHSLIMT